MIFRCVGLRIYLPLCRQLAPVHFLQQSVTISTSPGRNVVYEPNVNKKLDVRQLSTLKKLGIAEFDWKRYPNIFKIHPQTLEHHGLLLLEGGFKRLNAPLMINYFKIVKNTVHDLKLLGHIKPITSVSHSFLQQLGSFPAHKFDLDKLEEADMKFIDIYNLILKHFLLWRLETTESELLRIMNTYQRIKHKSLKYVSWTLDILEKDIGFSKEKILNHGYLIHSYPYNTLDTLNRVPVLCGMDIKTVLNRYPKIIMTVTDTIIQIQALLKAHNIPDEAVHRRGDIFTLGADSLRKRLMKMETVPEFKAYSNSPRVVQLVHYQRKASERILQLKELQRQCMSVHVLTSPDSFFQRYTQEHEDRSSGHDIINLLSPKLGVDDSTLRKSMRRHPFWCHVSLVALLDTLNMLLEMGYEKADVTKNVHLLLYKTEEVKNVLVSLPSRQEVIEAQSLTNKNTLTKCTELALCLYFLEREHHFTGNGMWTT